MLSRRLILLASAVTVLVFPTPASAIVNGTPVTTNEYPQYSSVVFVGGNTDGIGDIDRYCAGTLVGSRQVLTAARCASYGVNNSQELPLAGFDVRVGDVDPDQATQVDVVDNDRNGDYNGPTGASDVAMLTLAHPVDANLLRVVDDKEDSLWQPDTTGRVLGWGEIQGGFLSTVLRKGDLKIRPDQQCPNANFDADVMLCAAGESQNPCPGDSGSPLLVPFGASFVLAGVFSGSLCSTTGAPALFARVGDEPLNSWVHDRTPEADFDPSHQPRVNEPVTFTSTSRPALGAPDFTTFRWDLDDDGQFDDATGRVISRTYTEVGPVTVGIQASTPGFDTAATYFGLDVDPNPNDVPPTQTPTGPTTIAPPATNPVASAPLATILNAKRPRVRRGRFPIRIRFAKAAPNGTAVIEVYRGTRRIGIARTRVRRGATKRVRVKLTPTGRRILRRADSKRLKIRVRVRVGRKLLRTKQLTIRR